uniref:Putative secreted protein n=1 Tax=Ixodes ricinus TaxID=34613 RepID=A0A090XAX1_IXORI
MIRLTSSRTSASVLLFVLLVKQGACVQPECDPLEFYRIYSPVIFSLNFMVTGELNTPHILQQDCDDLKYVTQRVETLLQGCTADKDEDLKKHIRGLQLTRELFVRRRTSGRPDPLEILFRCVLSSMYARTNVDERLNKLKQDGALDATGDHTCRNRSLSLQCALQAGAGCPKNAERARKAVENYINLLMDVKMCRRPTEYACEGDLFDHCYWTVMSGPAGRLPLLPSGADTLSKYCKAAKSAPTCTRNLQIEQCPEEKKKSLGTIKDGFRSIQDSICNEELPASVEEWNKCLNQEALKKCKSEIPRPNQNFDTKAERHVHFCREREETLKCELAAGSDCPASASPAKKTLYDLRAIELDLHECPRPKTDGYGGSGFSTTPAILVTLVRPRASRCFPSKHTVLRYV